MAAVAVRCPSCHGVVLSIVFGIAEGVCCGRRIQAGRETKTHAVVILKVDRPPKRLAKSP